MESEICAKPYQNYIDGNGINSGRVVLHSDMNNFFASVECMLKPELTAFPVAVCGSEEDRHGIVLAKNYKAKEYGIKTAESRMLGAQEMSEACYRRAALRPLHGILAPCEENILRVHRPCRAVRSG